MIDGILEPVTVQRQRYLDFAEIVASLAYLAAQVDNSTPQEHLEELAALNASCFSHLAHLMTTAQPTSPPVDLGNGDSHAAAAADDLDHVAPLIAAVPADRDDVASLITEAPDHDDVASLITVTSSGRQGVAVLRRVGCALQTCGRKRESEACDYCAVHCFVARGCQDLCCEHWVKPHRCGWNGSSCMSSAPQKPPLCDFQLCRKHCLSQHCKAHGSDAPPPRQRGNRTPGARQKHKDRFAPYAGPKVWHNDR